MRTTLDRWRSADRRLRLAEAGLRAGCGGVIAAAVLRVVPVDSTATLLLRIAPGLIWGGLHLWRTRESPEQTASRVDAAGQTPDLMQTALAAERGNVAGSAELQRAVIERARRESPPLHTAAIRGLRLPRGALASAALAGGLSVLAVRPSTSILLATAAAPADGARPLWASSSESTLPPPAGEEESMEPTDADGRGSRAEGATSISDAPTAETAAQGATSGDVTGTPRSAGSDSSGAQASGEAPRSTAPRAEQHRTTDDLTDAPPRETNGPPEAEREHATPTAPRGEQDEMLWTPQDQSGHHSDGVPQGAPNIAAPKIPAPQILGHGDEPFWTQGVAAPGLGGANDADGTVLSSAAPTRDAAADLAEEWVEARWRDAPGGIIRAIEGGRTGAGSALSFRDVHTRYEAIAERANLQADIPQTRREYVRDYFDAIKTTDQSPPPKNK